MPNPTSDRLAAIRLSLSTIPGIVTCRVGLEPAIAPSDYPIIRIVPSRLEPTSSTRPAPSMTVLIYFATTLQQTDGMEALYESHYDVEQQIRSIMIDSHEAVWVQTEMDEDRIQSYKVQVSTFTVPVREPARC